MFQGRLAWVGKTVGCRGEEKKWWHFVVKWDYSSGEHLPQKQSTDHIVQVLNREDNSHIPSEVDGQGMVKVTLMPIFLGIILIKKCVFKIVLTRHSWCCSSSTQTATLSIPLQRALKNCLKGSKPLWWVTRDATLVLPLWCKLKAYSAKVAFTVAKFSFWPVFRKSETFWDQSFQQGPHQMLSTGISIRLVLRYVPIHEPRANLARSEHVRKVQKRWQPPHFSSRIFSCQGGIKGLRLERQKLTLVVRWGF